MSVRQLLENAATSSTAGTVQRMSEHRIHNLQNVLSGSGALTATTVIEVSLDGINCHTFCTFTQTGSDNVSELYVPPVPIYWEYVKARTIALTGTNAKVNTYLGQNR